MVGAVAGAVVGDHAGDAGDAVGGEEGSGVGQERDRGRGALVVVGLGVDQSGEAVHGRVEVGVTDLAPAVVPAQPAGFVGFGPAAVEPPAAAGWDASDLLHVQVNHVPWVAGDDLFGTGLLAQGLSVEVQVPQTVQSFAPQDPGDGAHRDRCALVGKGQVDAAGGPLAAA